MPVFWFLVILALFLAWVVFSFLYKPLGRFAHRIWSEAKNNMEADDLAAPPTSETDS